MSSSRPSSSRPSSGPRAATLRGRGLAAGRASPRALPQVNQVMEREDVRQSTARHGRALVAALVRERLDVLRRETRAGRLDGAALEAGVAALPAWVGSEARARTASTMRPVINATGVVLHTNLGRAILPESAVRRMAEVARAYTTLEYDLARGGRGSRSAHLDRVVALLFPGRAFHVVNNNAAAVLLALNTFAEGKEVVVSRGELVEIGGSFRIPDVLRKSGAILREIGTTNKTRLADYERAIGPRTGLILKVHPSNYRIVGFTAQAGLKEVAALGRRRRIPVVMDQGSGNLLDLARHGIRNEPSVHDALEDGADLVCFSGDKMLGGPQAGLIVGRPGLVKALKENSLSRALRVDKLTYAALEAILIEYVRDAAGAGLVDETRQVVSRGDGAGFGIGHQAARAQHPAEAPDLAHHFGHGDRHVEVHPTVLNFLDHLIVGDVLGPGLACHARRLTFGEDQDTHRLAQTMWQDDDATHLLIGLLGIDAEVNVHLHCRIELRIRRFLGEGNGFLRWIGLVALDLRCGLDVFFTVFPHGRYPSTVIPIERAVPSTCLMASSRSTALVSFILVSAISRTWARLTLPTLLRFGSAEPFSSPAALRSKTGVGGVLRTKVNDPSV